MLYNILKFLHEVSIAVWFGGLVTLLILNRLFAAAGDRGTMQALGRQGATIGTRLFFPAVIATLVTGIGMVQVNHIGFGTTWVLWGIIGLVGSMILGGALTGVAARKLAARIAAGDIDAAGVAAVQRRMMLYAVVNMLLLLSVIWAMVAKPA